MKKTRFIISNLLLLITFSLVLHSTSTAQCESWVGSPNMEKASDAHVIYKQDIKAENFDAAFKFWETAYNLAPAADGKRADHFTDGARIYLHKYKNTSNESEKNAYSQKIIQLYDQCVDCLKKKSIVFKNCNTEDCMQQKIGFYQGRQAFDMYYELNAPYENTYTVLKNSLKNSGFNSEYIVLAPFADIIAYLFSKEKVSKEEARQYHKTLYEIADHNIANNKQYGAYYQQAKDGMDQAFARIEAHIFDCDYFVKKLKPGYDADPDNPEVLEETIRVLKRQGCEETHPFLSQLEIKWSKYAAEINAKRQAEFEENNPAFVAKNLYDEGKYSEAIEKFKEALSQEEDINKKAEYHFRIASIEFRKQKSYSRARESARNAMKLKPNWGQPIMLIGDMYASSSRNCGDNAYDRGLAVLAAIDKYQRAKSIDPEVASEANKRISRYASSMPPKDEGFMRGVKENATAKVGCWIGESVRVRFKQ